MTVASTTGDASPYLRATVMSPRITLDVVLPTDQAVAHLMPGLLELMGSEATADGPVLHTSTGHVIDPELPLAGAMLRDGVVLRLVAEHEAPTEPIVSDLLDLLEAERPRWQWTPQAQQWTLAVLGMSVLVFAGGLWVSTVDAQTWPRLAIIAVATLAFSAFSAAVGNREGAWVSAGFAVPTAGLAVVLGSPTSAGAWAWGAAVLLCAIASAGWCHGQWRATLMEAMILGVLVGAAALSWLAVKDATVTCAVVATFASLTLGVLPRAALGVAGLLTADAQVLAGRAIPRRDARVLVDQAHHSVAGAVATCALGYAVAGFGLSVTAGMNAWSLVFVAATLAAWIARIRHFPLIAQRLSMCGAILVVGVGLTVGVFAADAHLRPWVIAICACVGVCVMAAGSLNLSAVAAAVLRRWVQRLETIAVVVTVPSLIGLLGVYADLLRTF